MTGLRRRTKRIAWMTMDGAAFAAVAAAISMTGFLTFPLREFPSFLTVASGPIPDRPLTWTGMVADSAALGLVGGGIAVGLIGGLGKHRYGSEGPILGAGLGALSMVIGGAIADLTLYHLIPQIEAPPTRCIPLWHGSPVGARANTAYYLVLNQAIAASVAALLGWALVGLIQADREGSDNVVMKVMADIGIVILILFCFLIFISDDGLGEFQAIPGWPIERIRLVAGAVAGLVLGCQSLLEKHRPRAAGVPAP
jgi:hypothetical protein